MSVTGQQRRGAEDLRKRLEKLSRHYDVDTMKVFMVVEALGESSLHAVYCPQWRLKWQAFLQRQEACRLDLVRHDKTRERYKQFLTEVGREEQGRQWFQALLSLLHQQGAADIFDYINNHKHHHQHHHHHHHYPAPQHHRHSFSKKPRQSDQLHGQENPSDNKKAVVLHTDPTGDNGGGGGFCAHLARLFEKKLETWFDSFQAVAVRLTAHVKVSGLVRVLSGQVHALCTRKGRLHAVLVKVTAQDTPRPLDVAELCLAKVMVIQNGLALPEDLELALLVLHVNATRPVLRLWVVTPSPEMETAIRMADIDDMIDAGRLSQYHELWPDNATTLPIITTTTTTNDILTTRTENINGV